MSIKGPMLTFWLQEGTQKEEASPKARQLLSRKADAAEILATELKGPSLDTTHGVYIYHHTKPGASLLEAATAFFQEKLVKLS